MAKIIGVIGGAGPFAGLDLTRKILEQTVAVQDQDHLTVINWSQPAQIADRTQFLLGETAVNPAHAIAEQLRKLEQAGAAVAAIPCNTAHAPSIFDTVLALLRTAGSRIKFLHMIKATADHVRRHHPHIRRLGVLSTTGTYQTRIYPQILEPEGYQVLTPDRRLQIEVIHPAIYDPSHGIKAQGRATPEAQQGLRQGIADLARQGAEAVILGCTEIPLAITEARMGDLVIVDPTLALARALISESDPARLKPLP